ncbi:hypothetical protein J0A71_10g21540 [Encephalitozoon cuniculi]|nr:hypothetical protein J0A71_10g21540 [Encephalitozoon cuniculi]
MEVDLRVRRVEIESRVTSVSIKCFFSTELAHLDDFTVTVPVYGLGGRKYEYTGSVFSQARDLVAMIGRKVAIGVLSERGTEVLGSNERPILFCLYRDEDAIKVCGLRRLIAVELRNPIGSAFARTVLRDCSRFAMLRKLRLAGCNIRRIPDFSVMKLTDLDLSHNNISGVVYLRGKFASVNLSHNEISHVVRIKASSLNVAHNRIVRFFQESKYQHLDLSHNPLEHYHAEAKTLNVSRTAMKSLESRTTRRLFVDGTKEIRLGVFESLVFLSMNDCGVYCLSLTARKLRVLKARNNFIEEIPLLPSLEYLDVSGNLVHKISSKGVRFLNASKNQIMTFDLSSWNRLVHLDLSYNPLVSLENSDARGLRFLGLRGTDIKSLGKNRTECFYDVHQCKEKKKVAEKFVVDPRGIDGRMFLISVHDPGTDISGMLETIQTKMRKASNPHVYLQRFCFLLRKMLLFKGVKAEYALCMVTPKHVIFNGRGIGAVFSNFAEVRAFDDPDTIEVYDNVGNWHLIPMPCGLYGSTARFDILDTVRNDLDVILDFIGHRCPLSVMMAISSTPKPQNGLCRGVELISRVGLPIRTTYEEAIRSLPERRNDVEGGENYNFVLKDATRQSYGTLLLNPNPIFAFCRLIPRDTSHRYVIGNVGNIMKMMSVLFSGTRIEFFSKLWIVAFHDRVEACLWGLKIQEMLKHVGIDVGVGITCGSFYTRIVGSHVRFYGPALNKASRIANLGVGVFCCHCVWTKHSRIMYINQGQRNLRGFKEPHLIYTPRLSEEM